MAKLNGEQLSSLSSALEQFGLILEYGVALTTGTLVEVESSGDPVYVNVEYDDKSGEYVVDF